MEVNFLSHSGQMQSGCLFLSLKELPVVLLLLLLLQEEDGFGAGVQVGVLMLLLLVVEDGSLSSSSFLRKPRSSMS